jgi:hypothetical protein
MQATDDASVTTAQATTLAEWMTAGASCLTAVAAFGALYIALATIQRQTNNSRFEKMFDAIAECNRRYLALRDRRHQFSDTTGAREYFGHFWRIQMEQWEYFRLGLIPEDIFRFWWLTRKDDFAPPGEDSAARIHPKIGRTSFSEGWAECETYYTISLPEFAAFVGAIATLDEPCSCDFCLGKMSPPAEDFRLPNLSPPLPEPPRCKKLTFDELISKIRADGKKHRERIIRQLST